MAQGSPATGCYAPFAVQIEPLEPSDCARVAELAALTGAGFDPQTELLRSYARLWVARREPGAPPLGFVLVWQAADELHLLDLAVAPDSRRAGAGKLLIACVLDHARLVGARVVLLEVRASNAPALALYRAAGFVECGVRRGYYSDNEEDAVLMRLDLASNSLTPASEP